MNGRVIQLKKAWTIEDHLGGGGFGTVCRARNDDGEEAAVKLVPMVPGRSRELLLAQDVSGLPNVVSLVDFGEDGGEYTLVMPLADRSLEDEMDSLKGAIPDLFSDIGFQNCKEILLTVRACPPDSCNSLAPWSRPLTPRSGRASAATASPRVA